MIGHGANEANRSRRTRKVPVARRARAGRSVVDVERFKLAQSRRGDPDINARPQLVARNGITRIPQLGIERGHMRVHSAMRARALVADGHVFDKAQVDGAVDGQSREGRHILVEPAHNNAVDLNGLKAPSQRRVDASHGLLKPAQARDLSKQRGVKCVERNVDAVKPGIFELRCQLRQQGAVGGKRDILDPRNRADVANERDDTAADQRLAARQAHAANALPRHQAHKAGDFLGTEQLVVRAGCHAIGRHAVNAAEIALVGNGNAQVVDIATKAVMLHVPVHAALPSRRSLFFGEYSTAREEWVDMCTTRRR